MSDMTRLNQLLAIEKGVSQNAQRRLGGRSVYQEN
jgi:hypothetical protein